MLFFPWNSAFHKESFNKISVNSKVIQQYFYPTCLSKNNYVFYEVFQYNNPRKIRLHRRKICDFQQFFCYQKCQGFPKYFQICTKFHHPITHPSKSATILYVFGSLTNHKQQSHLQTSANIKNAKYDANKIVKKPSK
jgi:hypothetical protein